MEWPHRFIGWSKTRTHPDDDHHLLIGRAEQVFVQDFPLRQVLRRDRLERGTFFVDETASRLFAWGSANEDLNELRVEAAVRSTSWDGRGTTSTCAESGSATRPTPRSRPRPSSTAEAT